MASGTSLGALFVELLFKDDEFSAGMVKAQEKLSDFGGRLQGLTDGVAKKFEMAILGITGAMVGLVAASSDVGARFEQQITKVAVLSGGSLDLLAESARRMGATTQYSAVEAANAMESLAQAGFNTTQIISGTEAALSLAAASGGELADSTKIVATTMSQFQLDADQAGRIADVFTQALNSSQLGMEDLTVAMSYAGTVGASFGQTLEETTAAVAMFSNLGLEGSKAGTAFRMAMSMAANVSREAEKTLARYGLTAKDINPELHNFGEILDTVGKVGMTASDAMKVFGTEVGGNVSALAQQSQSLDVNVKKFGDINQALIDSKGLAGDTAKEMTRTVLGAFEVARSAFDEILLTLYDTYSGPLRELLLTLADFFGEVATQFKFASGALSGDFATQIGRLTAWIKENQLLFANMIVVWMERLVEVGGALARIIPYLDNILVLMGAIWAVNKIVTFVSFLGEAYGAVVALQAALAALGVEVSVMTAGIYAAVVAVGAVIAALGAYILATDDATAAAERLTEAQDRQRKLNDDGVQREIAAMEAKLTTLKESAIEELATRQDLSKAREAELNQIKSLTAAEAVLALRSGKLVDVNGELRTASSLVNEAFDTADTSKLAQASGQLAMEQKKLTEQQVELKAQIDKVSDAVNRGEAGAHLLGAAIGAAVGDNTIRSLEEAQAKYNALGAEIQRLRNAQTQLKGDVVDAQREMTNEALAQQRQTSQATRGLEEFSKTARKGSDQTTTKLEGDRARLAAETAKLYQQTLDAAALANASEVESAQIKLDQQIRDITAKFAEEADLYRGNAERITAIEAQRDATIAAARAAFDAEQAAAKSRTDDEVARAMRDAEARAVGEVLAIRAEAGDESVSLEQERADKIRRLDEDLAADLANIEGLSEEDRKSLVETYTRATGEARLAIERDYAAKVAAAHEGFVRDQMKEPSLFARAWSDALKDIQKMIPDKLRIALARGTRETLQAARAMADAIGGVANSVSGMVTGLFDKLKTGIQTVTGLSLSIGGIVNQVVSGIQGQVEDSKRAAEEEGGNPAVVNYATAAAEIMTDILSNAGLIAGIFVEAVPVVLSTLAEEIPGLIQMVADSIPVVTQAIVDEVPKIVQGIIDSLPALLDASVESLDQILTMAIQLIADKAPQLIEILIASGEKALRTILKHLPDLLSVVLGKVLPKLIRSIGDSIPRVIGMLVEAFPLIIDAIVSSIPEILDALIYALPQIVTAIVDAIPTILIAVYEAIPDIVYAIVRALPMLFAAIVGMIPDILGEVISDLPDFFQMVITFIPDLAVAFIQGLIDGIGEVGKVLTESITGKVTEWFDKDGVPIWEEVGASIGKAATKIWEGVKGIFGGKGKTGAYSGIEYVPATMRVTLHKGERVVPADRNAQAMAGGPSTAGYDQAYPSFGGGGSGPIELAVLVDGQLLDGAIVSSVGKGRAPKIQKMIRAASGVEIGLDRGRYNSWG